jgi:hypothetical protein
MVPVLRSVDAVMEALRANPDTRPVAAERLIVTTFTPCLARRWRKPLVKAVTALLAEPYT